jgi:hypothetical protein
MKYDKKTTNIKGNLILVRHLQDGTIYRIKSNALYGLALGESEDNGETIGWASFSGKATYSEPGWDEPIGNHEFIMYVEDYDEPGNNIDRIWINIMNLGNDFGRIGYNGPCPPPGHTHKYFFQNICPGYCTQPKERYYQIQLEAAMSGHIPAQGEMVAKYGR